MTALYDKDKLKLTKFHTRAQSATKIQSTQIQDSGNSPCPYSNNNKKGKLKLC